MGTKETLINVGLLAAGGAAIAVASGVSGRGSRASRWVEDGDGFRRTDVEPGDEVEVLYVSELRMYLPYVKCAGHVLTFDAALPLAKAKAEASEAYETQKAYNAYRNRSRA